MYLSQWVALASGSLATMLNVSLIPFIVVCSSKHMGSYKYCLLCYTISATVMATSQAWYAPVDGYLFYSTTTIYPKTVQTVFIYSYIGGFTMNLVSTAWAFMTRLATLSQLGFLKTLKTIVPMFIFSLVYWSGCLISATSMHATEEMDILFSGAVFNVSGVQLSEVGYVGARVFKDKKFVIKSLIQLGWFSQFMITIMSCIFICWLKIRQRLSQLRHLQQDNFKFHYRLYVLLSFQALFPFIFNTLPALLTFIVGIIGVDLNAIIIVCGSILSFAQILDPLLTAYLITDYRKAISKLFGLNRTRIFGWSSVSH